MNGRSYLFGDALFETVRVSAAGPQHLDRHIARFQASGEELGFSESTITSGVEALFGLRGRKPGVWRVTVERSDGPFFNGLNGGGVELSFREWVAPQRPRLALIAGLYVPDDTLAEHKTTSYLRSVELMRRARAAGYDDGVGVSRDGRIGETSCRNIFAKIDGEWRTPPVLGLLPGTIRGLIVESGLARVSEIDLEGIRRASSLVLTSSVAGALCALELEGRTLHDDVAAFLEVLGLNDA